MATLVTIGIIVILASALFSGIEASLFAVPQSKVEIFKNEDRRGAKSLAKVKEQINQAIIVIVIFNNIANIVGSIYVGFVAAEIFESTILGVISAILTIAIIIFGEIIPKTIGESFAGPIALFISPILLVLIKVLYPVTWILVKITSIFTSDSRRITSEEELHVLSSIGHLEGSIEKDEKEMIQKVFNLNDLTSGDIMTPRTMVIALESSDKLGDIEDKIYNMTNSRLPVYDHKLDQIVGICQRQALLVALARDEKDKRVEDLMSESITVSPKMRVDALLPFFQKKKAHLAVVQDEFGVTQGVVTLEDVLEELVGEIVDETDKFEDARIEAKQRAQDQG